MAEYRTTMTDEYAKQLAANIVTCETRVVLDLDRYDLARLIQVIGESLASVSTRKPAVTLMVTEYVNGTSETDLFINDACFSMPTERIERGWQQ